MASQFPDDLTMLTTIVDEICKYSQQTLGLEVTSLTRALMKFSSQPRHTEAGPADERRISIFRRLVSMASASVWPIDLAKIAWIAAQNDRSEEVWSLLTASEEISEGLQKLRVNDLKTLARCLHIRSGGSKTELVERLSACSKAYKDRLVE
eukprot:TRINITY_DN13183_c0_g2_i1.p1 TRINITY_DN13183_c0_g2~~TRINITY_DN13183_c0_g2_i1.p1  ORF type:complete len:161 (-),score=28.32 TRINITY_DN13183_c0_g2_i1:90-542(-)